MYKPLLSLEKNKLITALKVNSVLLQLTYLSFPLTIYLIYNKAISYNNPNTIVFISIFLSTIMVIQFGLKVFESIQRNLLKSNEEITKKQNFIDAKLLASNKQQQNQVTTHDLSDISKNVNENIQDHLTSIYKYCILIYFILIAAIGKYIVLVPMLFISVNFIIAKLISNNYSKKSQQCNKEALNESVYIKEILNGLKFIKGLNIEDTVIIKAGAHIQKVNYLQSYLVYYKRILQRINMVINIINISFILLLGRYLFSLDILNTEQIVTCSLLTIWVARPLYHILFNIRKKENPCTKKDNAFLFTHDTNTEKDNNACDIDSCSQEIKGLEKHGVAYFEDGNHDIINYTKSRYKNICIAETDQVLFYGSLIDNLTLFNDDHAKEARHIISLFELEPLIFNLPYLYNYVISDSNDEVITYDLHVAISLIRELLKHPEALVINHNINRVNGCIKKGLIKYAKNNCIKLIINKTNANIKEIISKTGTEKTEELF